MQTRSRDDFSIIVLVRGSGSTEIKSQFLFRVEYMAAVRENQMTQLKYNSRD